MKDEKFKETMRASFWESNWDHVRGMTYSNLTSEEDLSHLNHMATQMDFLNVIKAVNTAEYTTVMSHINASRNVYFQ